MRALWVGLFLSMVGCEQAEPERPAAPPPAIPLRAPAPDGVKPPPRETVTLRWGGTTRPLAMDVIQTLDPLHRAVDVDLRPIGGRKVKVPPLPTRQALVMVVAPASTAEQRKVTLVSMSNVGKRWKAGHSGVRRFAISESGVIQGELEYVTQTTVEPILQLPGQPVAAGESWETPGLGITVTADSWVEESNEKKRRATLTAIETQSDGSRLAIIDFDSEDRRTGHVVSPHGKKTSISMHVHVRGHGAFAVEQGQWRTLAFTTEAQGKGLWNMDLVQRVQVAPRQLTPELVAQVNAPRPEPRAAGHSRQQRGVADPGHATND